MMKSNNTLRVIEGYCEDQGGENIVVKITQNEENKEEDDSYTIIEKLLGRDDDMILNEMNEKLLNEPI